MDNLEKHIRDNREAMDIHDPDPSLWNRIHTSLPAKHLSGRTLLWRAAVILLLAGAAMIAILRMNGVSGVNDQSAISIVKETDQYYNSLIRSLYSEAQPLLTANPDIKSELATGMNELESISMNIREDLKDNIATGEVIEALISNYRLRIELLEDMLQIMKEEKSENENKADYEI
jgi:hypothetical protein